MNKQNAKPIKTAYIHIGVQKTGTTSIQHYIYHNQCELENRFKLSVPTFLGEAEQYWLRALAAPWETERLRQHNHLFELSSYDEKNAQLISFLELSWSNSVIFSCEHLASIGYDAITNLKNLLSGYFDRFVVIAYFRQPLDASISWWATQLLGNHEFKSIGQDFGLPDPSPIGDVWRLFDPLRVLSDWERAFPGSIEIRLYNADRLVKGNVVSDFLSLLNIDGCDSPFERHRLNSSLSWQATKLVHFINRFLAQNRNFSSVFDLCSRDEHFAKKLSSVGSKLGRYMPSVDEKKAYDQAFAAGIDFLSRRICVDAEDLWLVDIPTRDDDRDPFYSLDLDESPNDLLPIIAKSLSLCDQTMMDCLASRLSLLRELTSY